MPGGTMPSAIWRSTPDPTGPTPMSAPTFTTASATRCRSCSTATGSRSTVRSTGRRDATGARRAWVRSWPRLVGARCHASAGDEPRTVLRRAVRPGRALFAVAAARSCPRPAPTLAAPAGPPSVLVFGKRLDEAFLHGLEQDFGIVARPCSARPPDAGPAALPLPGLDGRPPAYIAWTPRDPGGARLLMLPALLGSLLFCGFAGAPGGRPRSGRPGDRRERGPISRHLAGRRPTGSGKRTRRCA